MLEGLPYVRCKMQAQGYEHWKSILSFTRYVMGKKDIGLEDYIKSKMGSEEYNEYKLLVENQRVI